jgi:uncharacterized protein
MTIHHAAAVPPMRVPLWSGGSDPHCNIVVALGDLGMGVFARRLIRAGEKIMTFRGPLITFADAAAKDEWQCYPLQVTSHRYVDLTEPSCFANHSCEPNAGLRQLTLCALKDIPCGTEIRYDYSTTMDEDYWTMLCRCATEPCRGVITDFKYLDARLRKHYLGLSIVQPFIAIQYQ